MTKNKNYQQYHYVTCAAFKGVKIDLSAAQRFEKDLGIIGMSAKHPIKAVLKAVKVSPFKTVFVVRPEDGSVAYAVSQNEEYVAAAKKKGGGGGRPPLPPSPAEDCCAECMSRGADGCMLLESMACYCLYEGGGSGTGQIDTTETADQLYP